MNSLKRFCHGILLAVAMVAVAPSAYAQLPTCSQRLDGPDTDVRVTWSVVSQYTNGATIPSTALPITYTVYRAAGTSGGTFVAQCETPNVAATVYNPALGTYRFYVTATVNDGLTSAPSNVGTKTAVAAPLVPRAPTLN